MPRKTVAKQETAVVAPVRAAKPRVKSVKHSKAQPIPAAEIAPLSAHDRIALIAYGYWEARGFQPGDTEQDWLRAEKEYLLKA